MKFEICTGRAGGTYIDVGTGLHQVLTGIEKKPVPSKDLVLILPPNTLLRNTFCTFEIASLVDVPRY